jgi:serine/threonine protein kinase/tetratricopeptide (TPR) repeat protein
MAEFEPTLASSTQPQDSLSGKVVGRFRIGERLGKGGMGEVYSAEDTKLKRTVALKRLAPSLRADSLYRHRFLEEAERASRFGDAHVAAVYDVLEEQGEIFLILEYVEGQNLRQRLREPLSLDEFFTIALQCAEALVSAHRHGIVHCDIKPENIMLSSEGQVKILDFGVAKHLPRSDQSSTVDRAGTFAGTPAYMSPEVLLEQAPDGRADIFSLGVVFYEVLTGQHPFLAGSFVATTDRIRNETPAPIRVFNRSVPEGLQALVNKAMAKDAGNRYASAEELLDALLAVRSRMSSGEGPHEEEEQKGRSRTRYLLPSILAVVLLVGGVLASSKMAVIRGWFGMEKPPAIQLVVLPFATPDADSSAKAFSNGLTETLTAELTHLTGNYPLQVVPASEVRAGAITTVEQARKEFGVNMVLEGSLHGAGDQMRVTYSLVDATTRRQLHAEAITADAADALALEDRVVDGVLGMLGLEVESKDRAILAAHGTQDPVAYDFYLRGRGYLQEPEKPENIENAIVAFNNALERDKKYALAYAGLGEAFWARYELTHDPDWVTKAAQACERAVSFNPDLASGNTCFGTVYNGTGKYEEAARQFQRAVLLDPTRDDAFRGLAFAYERLGRQVDAERTFQRAIQVRPQYWASYEWLGTFYSEHARYEEAARQFTQAIALAPDNPHSYRKLGGVYIYMGRYLKAIEVLQRAIALYPTSGAYSNLGIAYFNVHHFDDAVAAYEHACTPASKDYIACGNLARAYYWAPGRRSQATEYYRRAIALAEERLSINPRDGDPHILSSSYYAMLGDRRHALEHLQRALELRPNEPEYLLTAAIVHNQFGEEDEAMEWLEAAVRRGYSASEIKVAPELDNLRGEARFQKLVEPR